MKQDNNNLAIIGASGTGKTVLAVGLYATSTETFTVSPVGDETRKYLEIRKTTIEEGFWPAATNESENFDLRLRLHAVGKQTDIVFREYMGERMEKDPNYIREVIGTPKSAMILFNPGIPGLSKAETRNRMLGNLKKIAQHLKDNGCIAVAFVVTAADRLSSDLKDFKTDFEAYASEVTNHLANLGINWKRFDVSISGRLDDQNKPHLARGENNTTHAPFLWLLDRIKAFNRRKRFFASAKTAAAVLALAAATFGVLVANSRSRLGKAEQALDSRIAALAKAYAISDEAGVRTNAGLLSTTNVTEWAKIPTYLPKDRKRKEDLVFRAKNQGELWAVRTLALEFASNTNKLATTPLNVQLTWFGEFDKELASSIPTFDDAVKERDALTNAWTATRVDLERICQTAHFRDETEKKSKNLGSAAPEKLKAPLEAALDLMADKDRLYPLVTNRMELCAGLTVARTNAIARYVDSKTKWQCTDSEPPADAESLIRGIRSELKSALTKNEFQTVSSIVDHRRSVARTKWERYQFPQRRKERLDELKAASDSPTDALQASLAFLATMDTIFPTIEESVRATARDAVTNERAAAIVRYLDSITPWKPEDDDPPCSTEELENKARRDLKSALTDTESENLSAMLSARCDEARRSWDAHHFPRRANDLETSLKNAGANPSRALRDSLAFLGSMTNDYPTISEPEFIAARTKIEEARKNALTAYADSIAGKWNINGHKPPEYDGEKIRDTILTKAAVTDEEATAFESDMNQRFDEASIRWKRKQRELVDNFKIDGTIESVVRAYADFIDANPNNPYLETLHDKMERRLKGYYELFMSTYQEDFFGRNAIRTDVNPRLRMEQAQQKFNEFRSVCLTVDGRSWSASPLQNRGVGKFAKLCVARGNLTNAGITAAFEQRFRITKVEAMIRADSLDSSYLGMSFGCALSAQRCNESQWETVSSSSLFAGASISRSDNGRWVTLWSGERLLRTNPWTLTSFRLTFSESLSGEAISSQNGSQGFWLDFKPGQQQHEYEETTFNFVHSAFWNTDVKGTISVRISFVGEGPDFISLWEEAKK